MQEHYQVENNELVIKNSENLQQFESFFLPILNYESEGLKSLHKRWFDNVREYFDRKEARIEKNLNKKNSDCVPAKKQKSEA